MVTIMDIMVIRTDRKTSTNGQTGQTDLTFKLYFPGVLCRATFAILAMLLLCIAYIILNTLFKLQSCGLTATVVNRIHLGCGIIVFFCGS